MSSNDFRDLTNLLHKYTEENPTDPAEILRLLFLSEKGLGVCFCTQDSDLRYMWINDINACFFPKDALGKNEYELFSSAVAEELSRFKRGVLESGTGAIRDVSIKQDGQEHHYRIAAESFVGTRGHPLGIVCVILDRTNELSALDEQRANYERIVAELLHRIKNNLSVIAAIIHLQHTQSTSPEAQEVLASLHGRVRAVSTIYTILSETKRSGAVNLADFIDRLSQAIHTAYERGDSIRLVLNIDPLVLPAQEANTVGLLVNELLTNAYKHAFPPETTGEIHCSLRRGKGEEDVVLTVSDTGRGCSLSLDQVSSTGLGFTLVRQLVEELGGTLKIENTPGACFTVAFIPAGSV